MRIEYWSDYGCPYCYIGETYLKKAIQQLQEEGPMQEAVITMRAFELDPMASRKYTGETVKRFAKKYRLSMEAAAERVDSISKLGKEAGIEFRYADTRYTNTFDAHRLTKMAQEEYGQDLAERISEHLYSAYFVDGKELADHEVLISIGVREGMDRDKIKKLLSSDDYADMVRYDENEASRLGVHGVPYFVVEGKVAIPGALSVPQMKQVLSQVIMEEENEVNGMSCGPDGCHIGGIK